MKKMYAFMEKCLDVEKQVTAFLYIISNLEQSYSEETQKEEKYLATTTLWMLTALQKELQQVIHEMDVYIAENGANLKQQ